MDVRVFKIMSRLNKLIADKQSQLNVSFVCLQFSALFHRLIMTRCLDNLRLWFKYVNPTPADTQTTEQSGTIWSDKTCRLAAGRMKSDKGK